MPHYEAGYMTATFSKCHLIFLLQCRVSPYMMGAKSWVRNKNVHLLPGGSALTLITELFNCADRNNGDAKTNFLLNEVYDLCMEYVLYNLIRLCQQDDFITEEARMETRPLSRLVFHTNVGKIELAKNTIISNMDSYLTLIKHTCQNRLGMTYLVCFLSKARIEGRYVAIYDQLCMK